MSGPVPESSSCTIKVTLLKFWHQNDEIIMHMQQINNGAGWLPQFLRQFSSMLSSSFMTSIPHLSRSSTVNSHHHLPNHVAFDFFSLFAARRRTTNIKPYIIYRIVSLSVTLSNLWQWFQGCDIFWSRISENRRVLLKIQLLLHKRKLYLY